ncbi:MAG TPA: hypothetical protein VFB45_25120 [Pseudolabrys sp.]|nr:hypothetical protein [Pseudolabrys sp.]
MAKDRAPYGDRADYPPPGPDIDEFPEGLAHKPTSPTDRSKAQDDARRGKLPEHLPRPNPAPKGATPPDRR